MACRPTKRKLSQEQKKKRVVELKEYNQKYRSVHKKKIRLQKQAYMEQIKLEGILHYGGKCACCGEKEIKFLTLEHKAGRAKNDKLTGKKAWQKVRQLGFPDTYTVLCFNCNCCKGAYGHCAHENH